jgi:hypothetical protein
MAYTRSDLTYLLQIGIRKEYPGLTPLEVHKMADDIYEQVVEAAHPLMTIERVDILGPLDLDV